MSINHLRNILPAGIILHVNDNLPMRERICCFIHLIIVRITDPVYVPLICLLAY